MSLRISLPFDARPNRAYQAPVDDKAWRPGIENQRIFNQTVRGFKDPNSDANNRVAQAFAFGGPKAAEGAASIGDDSYVVQVGWAIGMISGIVDTARNFVFYNTWAEKMQSLAPGERGVLYSYDYNAVEQRFERNVFVPFGEDSLHEAFPADTLSAIVARPNAAPPSEPVRVNVPMEDRREWQEAIDSYGGA